MKQEQDPHLTHEIALSRFEHPGAIENAVRRSRSPDQSEAALEEISQTKLRNGETVLDTTLDALTADSRKELDDAEKLGEQIRDKFLSRSVEKSLLRLLVSQQGDIDEAWIARDIPVDEGLEKRNKRLAASIGSGPRQNNLSGRNREISPTRRIA